MYTPFYIFIGQRYASLRGKNHFIAFISLASLLGIALGVAVLIVVTSVMNGFSKEIRNKLLEATPHITAYEHQAHPSPELIKDIKKNPKVQEVMPFIMGQGMISQAGHIEGLLIQGVDPIKSEPVLHLSEHLVSGRASLEPQRFEILLSAQLSSNLGLSLGDKVALIVPEITASLAGVSPRIKRFTLVGTFHMNPRFDTTYALIHIQDAARLFKKMQTGLQIQLLDELAAPEVAKDLNARLSHALYAQDWTHQFASFFEAIKMEKTVMMVILSLIVAVASFNLISSLVMMVTDKRRDIAVLRTYGATPRHIMSIFMIQGSLIGLIGTALGLGFGLLVAYNATQWYEHLKHLFSLDLINKQTYFIDFLPSEIHRADIFLIAVSTLIMSFLATLYPAWCALRVEPAEALRYE